MILSGTKSGSNAPKVYRLLPDEPPFPVAGKTDDHVITLSRELWGGGRLFLGVGHGREGSDGEKLQHFPIHDQRVDKLSRCYTRLRRAQI